MPYLVDIRTSQYAPPGPRRKFSWENDYNEPISIPHASGNVNPSFKGGTVFHIDRALPNQSDPRHSSAQKFKISRKPVANGATRFDAYRSPTSDGTNAAWRRHSSVPQSIPNEVTLPLASTKARPPPAIRKPPTQPPKCPRRNQVSQSLYVEPTSDLHLSRPSDGAAAPPSGVPAYSVASTRRDTKASPPLPKLRIPPVEQSPNPPRMITYPSAVKSHTMPSLESGRPLIPPKAPRTGPTSRPAARGAGIGAVPPPVPEKRQSRQSATIINTNRTSPVRHSSLPSPVRIQDTEAKSPIAARNRRSSLPTSATQLTASPPSPVLTGPVARMAFDPNYRGGYESDSDTPQNATASVDTRPSKAPQLNKPLPRIVTEISPVKPLHIQRDPSAEEDLLTGDSGYTGGDLAEIVNCYLEEIVSDATARGVMSTELECYLKSPSIMGEWDRPIKVSISEVDDIPLEKKKVRFVSIVRRALRT